MSKAIYIALFAAMIAAAVAVPVTDDLETQEEWGAIGRAVTKGAHDFGTWIKGKTCRERSCPGCETKYKGGGWGRRRTRYTDCTHRNNCMAENSKCKVKIDGLKNFVAELDVEIAEAKKVAAAHKATAAEKEKLAVEEANEAAAAKKALVDQQQLIANEAKALAAEFHNQDKTKKSEAEDVKEASEDHKEAIEEHKKKKKALDEDVKHEAKAAEDVKHAAAEKAKQIAEQKAANAKMAARVKAAKAKLAAAQALLKGFADAHQKEAAEAAKSEQAADSAREMVKVKQKIVKIHEDKKKEAQKKMESM